MPTLLSTYDLRRSLSAAAIFVLALVVQSVLPAQEAARAQLQNAPAPKTQDFGALFDAIAEKIGKHFWDKDRLAAIDWDKHAADARPNVAEAPTLEEAGRRINDLLGKLNMSHTGFLTPDDVDYYILLAVFGGAGMPKEEFDRRFWGTGVTYAGIGHYSTIVDGRHFVDAILEGSPAAHAGLKLGDEIVEVDGVPYHPIQSFKGKIGREVQIAVRREKNGPTQVIPIQVMSLAPLHAFREATRASARVIERDGRRIGYVHVWASVGDESTDTLREALSGLGVNTGGRGEQPLPVDGLIIDMRGKIGGTGSNAGRYLDVIDPRGPDLRSRNKDQQTRKATSVRGRTAVLIDHHTRSTGELFVHAYKREGQGPLIGSRTAGAVSAASAYAMPGGNLLYVAVSGLEVDGDVLEGAGVAPDIQVERPIPYAQGADPVLERAVDVLVSRARQRNLPAPASSN